MDSKTRSDVHPVTMWSKQITHEIGKPIAQVISNFSRSHILPHLQIQNLAVQLLGNIQVWGGGGLSLFRPLQCFLSSLLAFVFLSLSLLIDLLPWVMVRSSCLPRLFLPQMCLDVAHCERRVSSTCAFPELDFNKEHKHEKYTMLWGYKQGHLVGMWASPERPPEVRYPEWTLDQHIELTYLLRPSPKPCLPVLFRNLKASI